MTIIYSITISYFG